MTRPVYNLDRATGFGLWLRNQAGIKSSLRFKKNVASQIGSA